MSTRPKSPNEAGESSYAALRSCCTPAKTLPPLAKRTYGLLAPAALQEDKMLHNDDAFVTMLLMSQINPSREELVLPFTSMEWHQLYESVTKTNFCSLGELLRADMSQVQFTLGCSEEEAYRICVLLGRTLPLSISLEKMELKGIDVMTYEERPYPDKLRDSLADKAPPMLYIAGRPELLKQSAIAVLGAMGVRGNEVETRVRELIRTATLWGYVVVLDGQDGLGQVALDEVIACGGRAVLVLAGGMAATLSRSAIQTAVERRQIAIISQFHPDAPYTRSHANHRNKCIYALAQAAFVFACDEEKGSTWAGAAEVLRSRWCKFVYVYDTNLYSGNRPLIQRGAQIMPDFKKTTFEQLSSYWSSATAEQLCMFEWN